MSLEQLFRPDALNSQGTRWYGEVLLVRPLSIAVLATLAAAISICVCVFLWFGSYTRHVTASGQLVPDKGLIKIYSPQSGVIIEKRVKEGQTVEAGDVLFVLSRERRARATQTEALIAQQVQRRQESVLQELKTTQELEKAELQALRTKIRGLTQELKQLDSLIREQRTRVSLSEDTLEQYRLIQAQGLVTKETLLQKQQAFLDQRAHSLSLERDRIALARQLDEARDAEGVLSLSYRSRNAPLVRELASTEQELSEAELRWRIMIVAPAAGHVASLVSELGQTVDPNKALASIIPTGSKLQAHLYIASRSAGFLREGAAVRLRFPAFPYQRFGQYQGTARTISTAALSQDELWGSRIAAADAQSGEPVYRVAVELATETIRAGQAQYRLTAGMLVEADLVQERRRIVEWVFEPMYAMRAKMKPIEIAHANP